MRPEEERGPADLDRKMEWVEIRYELEDEMMRCVERGNEKGVYQLMGKLPLLVPTNEFASELRRYRTYVAAVNTLCRKAAQRAKVHPYYLDELSGRLSQELDQAATMVEIHDVCDEIVRRYCLLVRNHAGKNYSKMVRKASAYVELNLGGDLSLKHIAQVTGVSPKYLSARFKEETGIVLTEYIGEQRIRQPEDAGAGRDLREVQCVGNPGI